MFEGVKKRIKTIKVTLPGKKAKLKPKSKKNLAIFVDGPNILRKELGINLRDVKEAVYEVGTPKIAKVFLNQFASNKLVEAVANEGFESVIVVGDVDVAMAVDAAEAIFNPVIQGIVFVTRDSDFLPAIIKAKKYGKETFAIIAEESSAAALKNAVDQVIVLNKK